MTNKHHAEGQIGKRYCRLEHARLAGQKRDMGWIQASHHGFDEANVIINELEIESDPDLRYHISSSKKLPIQLFAKIGEHCGDPAYDVNFLFSMFVDNILTCRI